MKQILTIHIPRTGGGTFYNIITTYFQYIKMPDKSMKGENRHFRRGGKVSGDYIYIQGHFSYEQCAHLKNYEKVTWLRHPVERVISRYFYPNGRPDWSEEHLLKWCKDRPKQQNRMIRQIHSLENMNLILRTEKYEKSIRLFSKWSGYEIPEKWYNIINIGPPPKGFKKNVVINKPKVSESTKKELEKILKPDMDMYNQFLDKYCHKSLL